MTSDRDRILSEFVDAWNAGRRPEVDDFLALAPAADRGELAEQLLAFLSFAPTPAYSDEALDAIRAEPVVADALAAVGAPGGLLPAVLPGLRRRLALSTAEVAGQLVSALGVPRGGEPKAAAYLERLERGDLEPARVSRRVFDALARILGVARDELEGAADLGGWRPHAAMASGAMFRAEDEAADAVAEHLDVLADALSTPGRQDRDEIDDLFLGGR